MERGTDDGLDALAIVRRREPPRFYVVDAELQVVFRSDGADTEPSGALPREIALAAGSLIREIGEGANGHDTAVVSGDVLVRVVCLEGTGQQHQYGLFVERFALRNSVAAAMRRFGLSTREGDVLEGLLRGEGTQAIADRLFIAESTVLEHVRNIGRKTSSKKRGEIVATVVGLRDEGRPGKRG